jgi:lipid II:glycine glycyltransferase (peptidoglycan interpeptide bridge formation enzyme)
MNKYPYVKQSAAWGAYLECLGWKYFFTEQNVGVAVLKTPLGRLAKVQRPYILTAEVLSSIDSICKENRAFLAKIEPNLDQDAQVLADGAYKLSASPLSPPTSMYIDLDSDKETLWGNLTKSGKYGVRRAYREGARVEFFEHPSLETLQEYYTILRQTEKRGRFISYSFKEIEALNNSFGEKSYLSLVYDKEGCVAGGKHYVGHCGEDASKPVKPVVTYLSGGTSNIGLGTKAGYALFWAAFEYFKNKGYVLFDLEGCYDPRHKVFTKKWKGFTEFKKKFGPEVVEFEGCYTKFYSPIAKFLLPGF